MQTCTNEYDRTTNRGNQVMDLVGLMGKYKPTYKTKNNVFRGPPEKQTNKQTTKNKNKNKTTAAHMVCFADGNRPGSAGMKNLVKGFF